MATQTNSRRLRPGNPTALAPADRELRRLRVEAETRVYVAARFHGARNHASTGLGKIAPTGLDIAAEGAALPLPGQNPYNNWLTKEARPRFTVYPRALGVYIGSPGDDCSEDVAAVIAEHCTLEFKVGSRIVLDDPIITLPSGLGIDRQVSSSNGTNLRASRLGPAQPVGLATLPRDLVLTKDEQIQLVLKPSTAALAAFAAIAGDFPTAGMVIGVAIFGDGKFGVGATR